MKVYLNSRMALFYPGNLDKTDEVEQLLKNQRIEMRLVQPEALQLTVAALAGYVNTPVPERTYEGEAPSQSCVVFSGLTEEKLNRALDKLKEADLGITYKAVLTNDNRDWAFGALMQELQREEEEQQNEETSEAEKGANED